VGTEFNMVNRLRPKNTYVLSSTKPECPTMNETVIEDLYNNLISIKNGTYENEIIIPKEVEKYAKIALNRMFEV
jgi:quinolinate synthase